MQVVVHKLERVANVDTLRPRGRSPHLRPMRRTDCLVANQKRRSVSCRRCMLMRYLCRRAVLALCVALSPIVSQQRRRQGVLRAADLDTVLAALQAGRLRRLVRLPHTSAELDVVSEQNKLLRAGHVAAIVHEPEGRPSVVGHPVTAREWKESFAVTLDADGEGCLH